MTCVVGIADKGVVYMGADSCASSDDEYEICNRNKIISHSGWLLASSGSYRKLDVLEYNINKIITRDPDDNKIDWHMRREFIDNLRSVLKENNLLSKDEDGLYGMDTGIMVGYKGHLFDVQQDFSVLRASDYGIAIGSGSTPARTMLQFLNENIFMDYTPTEIITYALEMSNKVCKNVSPPYLMLSTEGFSQFLKEA